jgi:pectin methylesterase-like acyl-CoA thioesterase
MLMVINRAAAAISFFPANGADAVCPDTPLRVTFDSDMHPPVSSIKILDGADQTVIESFDFSHETAVKTIGGLANYNYYPFFKTDKEIDIYPARQFAYNKTYDIQVNHGFIAGSTDPHPKWQIKTRTAPPDAGAKKLTVAADGTGDFCTVQGALDFLPDGNKSPVTIFVRKGIYTEMIYFANKHSVTLLGEDRKQTIIQYATNNNFNHAPGVYRRGVLLAQKCNDFTLANLTIRNTTPHGGSQAEAIIFNGSTSARAIVHNVDLFSFQDTLQINGQAYVSDCYIEGDVDYMWGTGPCFFENCLCHSVRSNAYYTQIRNPATNHGYVYLHCTFDGADGVKGNFLSRIEPTRFPASEVVLIDCVQTDSVGAVAWRLDSPPNAARGNAPGRAPASRPAPNPENVHFWEYNSHTPDGKPVDVSKRAAFSRQLNMADDKQTIADYSDPIFVLGNNWKPNLPPDVK